MLIKPTPHLLRIASHLVAECAIAIAEGRKGVAGQPDGANPVEALGFATQLITHAANEAGKFFEEEAKE